MNVLCEFSDNVGSDKVKVYFLLLSGKSFFAVKNKAEILQEDFMGHKTKRISVGMLPEVLNSYK